MQIYAVIITVLMRAKTSPTHHSKSTRYQNHSKSGLFYKNHQSQLIQTLKINDQSS